MLFESRIIIRIGLIGGFFLLYGLEVTKIPHIFPQPHSNTSQDSTSQSTPSQESDKNKPSQKTKSFESEHGYAGLQFQKVAIPGATNITIDAPEGEIMEVELYNMLGARITSTSHPAQQTLSQLKEGIFFITITYNDGTKFVQKLVNIGD